MKARQFHICGFHFWHTSFQGVFEFLIVYNLVRFNPRWAKGGVVLQGARESVFTTKADHSFFTEPVSCLVFNAVGKTNVSILVDVHCESHGTHLTLFSHLWPTLLTTVWSQRHKTQRCCVSSPYEKLLPFLYYCVIIRAQQRASLRVSVCLQSVRFCWWSRSPKR